MGVANVLQKCCKGAAEMLQKRGGGVAERPPPRPRKRAYMIGVWRPPQPIRYALAELRIRVSA
eukprot:2751526-Alexandrium_andersonii.AAC.1